jgi:hypothetical protein
MPATVRPATLADAPAITELLNAVDLIEIGRPETDLHTVEADLKHPEADLERDSWLAFEGDRLVAYGLLWDESGGERIDIDHYVLPDHQDAGFEVFAAMEARALGKARDNGARRAVVHLHLNVRPTTDTARLRDRGWQDVRRYHVLRRPLDPAADVSPALPDGVRIRPCASEADRRLVHQLYHVRPAFRLPAEGLRGVAGGHRRRRPGLVAGVDRDHGRPGRRRFPDVAQRP